MMCGGMRLGESRKTTRRPLLVICVYPFRISNRRNTLKIELITKLLTILSFQTTCLEHPCESFCYHLPTPYEHEDLNSQEPKEALLLTLQSV